MKEIKIGKGVYTTCNTCGMLRDMREVAPNGICAYCLGKAFVKFLQLHDIKDSQLIVSVSTPEKAEDILEGRKKKGNTKDTLKSDDDIEN
jgi:hypothetical protein